ncbi:diguanylate cyclase [Stieleria sp. TO1_6]|uniref:sensor domain-containing diguanylate cyclase/phosphohydrolase n=1 Tax=Stieleria tagensis TaxID=2956795 RepID=UPI00209B78EF|nr:diguanylate cyclase [Stieleria tagensis]MCO8123410.1 diguanylate cyclase [Stieleria tagensis]
MSHLYPPPESGQVNQSFITFPAVNDGDESVSSQAAVIENVNGLLAKLQTASEAVEEKPLDQAEQNIENQLAVVRLGIATSLFYALRTKHPSTAAHGLRVALFCSGWAERMGLDYDLRDRIEVAALLHDVGKIGIPDRILRKPGKLTVDEQLAMDSCPDNGCEILRGCTNDPALLEIVRFGGVWYDSRRGAESPRGDQIPLGARMLAIADAFDAMTTEHVYRPALSRDRAIAELIRASGTQFDPNLVGDFCRMLEAHPEILQGSIVHRWLQQLRPEDSEAFWTGKKVGGTGKHTRRKEVVRRETLFNQHLLQTLKDGVTFTDAEGTIDQWNVAMERLTQLPAEAMIGKQWSVAALRMRDADHHAKQETVCPLQECLRSGEVVRRAMVIDAAGSDPIPVHVEVAPVPGNHHGSHGTVIVVHDLSDLEHLERRLHTLHKQTTIDALTRVANRAHFDETLNELVTATTDGGPTFSLVICDLDHFKRINDTFGHPAGDEALKVFAGLLRSHSREGDLVARYGGEEFLLLAASCDNATGARRAEIIRQALESTPIECLGNECITASFGVTEFQSGDSPQTIVARADRALLKAKDNGRNRVVQLGLGKMSEIVDVVPRTGWFDWLTRHDDSVLTVVDILTPVPIDLAIEKLRGFIADHEAEIVNVAENQLTLKVASGCSQGGRRRVDHKISFHATMTLSHAQADEMPTEKSIAGGSTKVHLELKPIRNRDRRRREIKRSVAQLVSSFRCYLMGDIINQDR